MIENLSELKKRITEKADYYEKIEFPVIAGEYREFVNLIAEYEAVVRERDELQEKITKMTFSTNEQKEKIE